MSDPPETNVLGDFMASFTEHMKHTRVQGEIEFPIEVSAVKNGGVRKRLGAAVGSWCSIRPCDGSKTYLGVYLGDLTLDIMHSYNVQDKVLTLMPHTNPAIYVPDLKRIVWGCESWWGVVETPADLRKITDADIQNVWHVKALKELQAKP